MSTARKERGAKAWRAGRLLQHVTMTLLSLRHTSYVPARELFDVNPVGDQLGQHDEIVHVMSSPLLQIVGLIVTEPKTALGHSLDSRVRMILPPYFRTRSIRNATPDDQPDRGAADQAGLDGIREAIAF